MFHTADMLKAFLPYRGDAIVVPGRGGRHWIKISDQPGLDVPLGDPAMGGHAAFAFGLALALPQRKIVLFDSEGDVQMGLGILLTIAEHQPANFYHFMLDNECYATTGGQPVPNAKNVAYDLLARGAGYPRALAFVAMKVHADVENKPITQRTKWQTRSRPQIIRDLQLKLGLAA
jgi:phosphonopyruvate decarboxylase